ncbi:hypothetical protein M5K25_010768 [Dendrobium thyrsiflorum]|uniref:Uncharacterized protein n=2 Tax=Dendrobium TaxID=37818 RepID=A0A8T3BBW5_DENNO|nr:hypothetical protein KFK09_011143 [Dendrobium nobile]
MCLPGVDVKVEGDDDDGEDGKEDEGVDEDGLSVGPHAAELCHSVVARKLEEEPRRKQNE